MLGFDGRAVFLNCILRLVVIVHVAKYTKNYYGFPRRVEPT